MDEERKYGAPLAACCIIIAILAAYVAGYFVLPIQVTKVGTFPGRPLVIRVYRHKWLAKVYWPLGKMEGTATGTDVTLFGAPR